MKLLKVHIENFRLLKDISFEFATKDSRNLTVIRAENESGKTTLLTALQWGLFGDKALPNKGSGFRLSPNDASAGEEISVRILVEIDYEVATRTNPKKYRLIRHVSETVHDKKWERGGTHVELLHLTAKGAEEIDTPDAHISSHLPNELREVFFTDGDRALSFIEGDRNNQVKRVEGAIRSLLGLTIVEDALDRTRKVKADLNRNIRRRAGNDQELTAVSSHLTALEKQLPTLEKDLLQAEESRRNLEDLEENAERQLSDVLLKGNQEELEKQRQEATSDRKSAEKDEAQAAREHANLFKSELIGKHLLASPFTKAKTVLDDLYKQDKIPSRTIPVLENRLNQPTCICGETLSPDDPDGLRRRTHIQCLIDDSRNSDAIQKKVTALYFGVQDLLKPVEEITWAGEYDIVFARRQSAAERCRRFGEREADIDAKIKELPDVDIQQLRSSRNRYREQLDEVRRKEVRLKMQLKTLRSDIKSAEAKREKLLQNDKKGMQISAEFVVANDLEQVLTKALDTMKTKELQQVSERMNFLFLKMIGDDSTEKGTISRAAITDDFRIVVFGGIFDHPLNPSHDLNGASRRALTIAFILALTQVSEVEAPNVIDTPLGMTSGYVRQAILQIAAQQSSQLILFLTHSEILGCEDIMDKLVGQIYTLTNSTFYPKKLVNKPSVNDARVLLCDCNHHEYCQVCERREMADLSE